MKGGQGRGHRTPCLGAAAELSQSLEIAAHKRLGDKPPAIGDDKK